MTLAVVGCAQVEKVSSKTRDEDAGQGPGESGRPEAGAQKEEHVGNIHGVVRGSQSTDGGNGESIGVAQHFTADVPKLPRSDAEKHASDGAQSLARRMAVLGDTALLVDGRDTLFHDAG